MQTIQKVEKGKFPADYQKDSRENFVQPFWFLKHWNLTKLSIVYKSLKNIRLYLFLCFTVKSQMLAGAAVVLLKFIVNSFSFFFLFFTHLTLFLSYFTFLLVIKNYYWNINLLFKSIDWFLYEGNTCI